MKYLIAGLGNIGYEYCGTRHNIGFDIADKAVGRYGGQWTVEKLAARCEIRHKGRVLIFIKPTTYMNRSGRSVRYWLNLEKIPMENLLVLVDDLALDFGTIRIKGKGSAGGHNGLTDIQEHLQTTRYPRLRFGIGADYGQGRQVDYVLGKWSGEESEQLSGRMDAAVDATLSFCTAGLADTMNRFNNK